MNDTVIISCKKVCQSHSSVHMRKIETFLIHIDFFFALWRSPHTMLFSIIFFSRCRNRDFVMTLCNIRGNLLNWGTACPKGMSICVMFRRNGVLRPPGRVYQMHMTNNTHPTSPHKIHLCEVGTVTWNLLIELFLSSIDKCNT